MANKRKTLFVDQKAALIRAIENGEKKSDVGRRFGLGPSTVTTIWKSKEKILQAETEGSSCKRIRKPKFEDLDQAMLMWFHKQRCDNEPISGPILKTKAEKFAQQLGITDFKASEGWLGKFKQRHNIIYGQISEEVQNVTRGWLHKIRPKLNKKCSPDNIFNADETGTFNKTTPGKTLKFNREKFVGGKLSKKRITAFVAANMNDTEKKKIMALEKSEKSRKNYVEIDKNLVTTISLTDEEILNSVTKGEEQKEDKKKNQPDEFVPSIQQALDAAKLLEKYLLFHEDDPKLFQDMGEIHKKIEKKYLQNKQIQIKLTD